MYIRRNTDYKTGVAKVGSLYQKRSIDPFEHSRFVYVHLLSHYELCMLSTQCIYV